jgi:hypothetical protein
MITIDTPNFSLIIISISIILFYILNLFVKKIVYKFKKNDENINLWRLKNTCVSWLHSIICSTLIIRRYLSFFKKK